LYANRDKARIMLAKLQNNETDEVIEAKKKQI
jgi:hypothetical protein